MTRPGSATVGPATIRPGDPDQRRGVSVRPIAVSRTFHHGRPSSMSSARSMPMIATARRTLQRPEDADRSRPPLRIGHPSQLLFEEVTISQGDRPDVVTTVAMSVGVTSGNARRKSTAGTRRGEVYESAPPGQPIVACALEVLLEAAATQGDRNACDIRRQRVQSPAIRTAPCSSSPVSWCAAGRLDSGDPLYRRNRQPTMADRQTTLPVLERLNKPDDVTNRPRACWVSLQQFLCSNVRPPIEWPIIESSTARQAPGPGSIRDTKRHLAMTYRRARPEIAEATRVRADSFDRAETRALRRAFGQKGRQYTNHTLQELALPVLEIASHMCRRRGYSRAKAPVPAP